MAQTINLNTTPGGYPVTLFYSQGDIGREFNIKLASSDGYVVPSGATVKMVATKPSGFGFEVTGTLSNGTASFTTTETMTNEAGRFPAEIRIIYNNNVIGTANFFLEGERDPHPEGTTDGDAETIIPELTLLVERVETAASSVLDMQVEVQTLAAGSQATYSYDEDTNTQTWGIPQGEAGAGAAGTLANAYSSSATYAVGDYVLHNSDLYICTTAITTAESFTAAHWSQVVLADGVSDLKSDLNDLTDGLVVPGDEISGDIVQFNSTDGQVDTISIDDTSTSTAVIHRCGINLYPKYSDGSDNGLSWTVGTDGTITFTGTPTADTLLRYYNPNIPLKSGENKAVAFFNNMADTNNRLSFFGVTSSQGSWQVNLNSINKTATVTHGGDSTFTELRIRIPKDFNATGMIIKPMMVVGSSIGEFEGYNGQILNVTVDNGVVQDNISLLTGLNTIWAEEENITVKFADEAKSIAEYVGEYVEEQTAPFDERFYRYTESGTSKYLQVCFRSGIDHYICYELHNVPAPLSNSDTWQLGHTVACDIVNGEMTNTVELIEGGEYELAMRENGAADYCGGNNHGDENTVTFKLFIDGEQITDLSSIADGVLRRFNRIDAFDISLVDRCNTPNDNIAQHQKHWTFENGKVEVQQTLKFLQNLLLDVVLLCMCCAKRTQFPYGIRQGRVDIEDMSASGFSHITTYGNDISYFYFGANATINIKAKTDSPATNGSALYINSTTTQNKLYLGYYQATNSANPTSVSAGDIIQETSVYDVAYN